MNSRRWSTFGLGATVLSLLLVLSSCGGGGNSSSSSGAGGSGGGGSGGSNASPGGIWNGTESQSGLAVIGVVDEAGEFHFIRADNVQYAGAASVSGSSVSASIEGFTPAGTVFPDGSTHGTGMLTGSVVERSSMSGNTTFTTDKGSTTTGTISLTFNSLYNRTSSLDTISGNFTDPISGDVIAVSTNGTLSWRDPPTGCTGSGTVSIINASYDVYRVQFSYVGCTGSAAVLNGVQFSGLGILDNTVLPERAIVGVNGQSGTSKYAVVYTLQRSGGGGATAPAISTQPQNASVLAGMTTTFTVTATGTAPLTYQWSKNGTAITGATSANYTTPPAVLTENGASFTVTITNSAGSITSAATTLTVTTNAVAPVIATQPQSTTVSVGQTASFSVGATGSPTPTYQWSKNGTPISGATSSSYTTPATALADSGATFTVTVTNLAGSVTSSAATLTVSALPNAPAITAQPQSITVAAGATATFAVTATGAAPLSYQWKKNGTAIGGATAASYTTPATARTDNGAAFTVTVTNAVGNATSNAATLTVNTAPVITTQPVNVTVTAGQTATFSVTATGTASLSYQWSKNGTVIPGATSAIYTTPATTLGDNGATFTVTVSNSVGPVTSSAATLTVTVGASAPTITAQPQNTAVSQGQSATFSVIATGTAPINYQWQKNGVNIAGATSASYTTPVTLTSDNGGQYDVVVSNSGGSITSSAALLGVTHTLGLVAGALGGLGHADAPSGPPTVATFYGPAAVATDGAGNVYVADGSNNTIRMITPAGVVTTLAGTAGTIGSADGTGAAASFNAPGGIAVDASGNVYVADTGNDTLRKITPTGVVTTLAGSPGVAGSGNGVGAAAHFDVPSALGVDASGSNLYVADTTTAPSARSSSQRRP
jgi:hypothetical protein